MHANNIGHRERRAGSGKRARTTTENIGWKNPFRSRPTCVDAGAEKSKKGVPEDDTWFSSVSETRRNRDQRDDQCIARRRYRLMRSLLDVNVLIALLDSDDTLHDVAAGVFPGMGQRMGIESLDPERLHAGHVERKLPSSRVCFRHSGTTGRSLRNFVP